MAEKGKETGKDGMKKENSNDMMEFVEEEVFSQEEEKKMKERLKSLGYLE